MRNMKKFTILFLTTLLWSIALISQTTIQPGNVSGVWTSANSPYQITGNVTVVGTLIIQQGVTVEFMGDYEFTVYGVLTVNGTDWQPVLFKSNDADNHWQGIYFNSSSAGSELNYCIIESSHNSGIRISNSSPLLYDCIIRNNVAVEHGGGIKVSSGTLTMERCKIESNQVSSAYKYGGGVYVGSSANMIANNCLFDANIAGKYGGGFYCEQSDIVTLSNCIILKNSTKGLASGGGGISMDRCLITLNNCLITKNKTGNLGGSAIRFGFQGHAVITNCVVANNTCPYKGVINLDGSSSSANIRNSIIFLNNQSNINTGPGTANIEYSCVEGGFTGTGNIDTNPQFTNPNQGNYTLISPSSPCIDAGDPDSQYNDGCIPPSLGDVRNDMGLYGGPGICEWNITPSTPVVSATEKVYCDKVVVTWNKVSGALNYDVLRESTLLTNITDTVYTDFDGNAIPDLYQVIARNTCCYSDPGLDFGSIKTEPSTPGPISGASSLTIGESETYTIAEVYLATSYDWEYNGIAEITGGNLSIELTPTTSGTLKVRAVNNCGESDWSEKYITVTGGPSNDDFYIQNESVNNTTIEPGQAIEFECDQCYSGTTPDNEMGDVEVGFYLSNDHLFDNTDILLDDNASSLGSDDPCNFETDYATIPSNTPNGEYYILFVADHDGQFPEVNENNNVEHKLITVTNPLPDLIVQGQSANPTSITAGESTTVNCTVTNNGDGSAGTNYVGFYLSDNTTWGGSDVDLGSSYVSSLNPGSSSSISLSVTIPSGTAPNTYYILYYADHLFDVAESNENNNVEHIPISVNGGSSDGDDFYISNPEVNTTSIMPGETLNLECDQCYSGIHTSNELDNVWVGFYLSLDPDYSHYFDTYLGKEYSTIGNNDLCDPENQSGVIPLGTEPGTYYILFVADYEDEFDETDENNNVEAIQITVANPLPDLIIQNQNASPTTVEAGGTIDLSCIVKNIGDGSAGTSNVGYYLSDNTIFSASDDLLGSNYVSTLIPGATSRESQTVTIPAGTAPGTYYIFFDADYQDNVSESNENNNDENIQISVTEEPYLSLTPTSLYFPATGGTKTFNVSSNSTQWEVTSMMQWLSFEPEYGSYDGTVTVTAEPNPNSSMRLAEINVWSDVWNANIYVHQEGTSSFTCGNSPVSDYDGNIYNTVQIGNQCWMKENMKTTHYADGEAMVYGNGAGNVGENYITKFYFDFGGNSANTLTYGHLYTWAAIVNGQSSSNSVPSGIQGLCPVGWHVPSDNEYITMERYLGMSQEQANLTGYRGTDEGGKIKETGFEHWIEPNTGATNSSEFTALPGGHGINGDFFLGLGSLTYLWSSTDDGSINSYDRRFNFNQAKISRNKHRKDTHNSVRCLKDFPSLSYLVFTVENVECYGQATGSINLSIYTGTAPYVYEWSNGAATQDLNNVPAGIYEVTVTDANGSFLTESCTISQPSSALSLSFSSSNVSCNGGSNGSINLTPSGGTSPYTYYWNDGYTSQNRSNLSASTYTVTVTDANSCATTGSQTITEPPVLAVGQINGEEDVCSESEQTYYISSVPYAENYTWQYNDNGNPNSTGTSVTFSPSSSGTLKVRANNSCGSSDWSELDIDVNYPPIQPSAISGATTPCQNTSGHSYWVSHVSGVSYNWNYEGDGETITSGQGSNSITVSYSSNATSGEWIVTPSNSCGNGNQSGLDIIMNSVPSQPGLIIGDEEILQGSTNPYSISEVLDATSYDWDYEGDGEITGTGINITLLANSSGILKVKANNECGSSDWRLKTITLITPFITVTSPSSGDSWQAGTNHNITWDDNISESVKVELYSSGSFVSTIASNVSSGSFLWTIPAATSPGTYYKVKVTSLNNNSLWDYSDYFTIDSDGNNIPEDATQISCPHQEDYEIDPSVDVDWYRMYLNSGTNWKMYTESINGSQLDPAFYFYGPHSYNGSDVEPTSYLYYNDDGHGGWQPELNIPITQSGYYYLRVAYYQNSPTLETGKKKNGTKANTGDYRLNIIENYITVTSPTSGDAWQAGTDHFITWDDNINENVSIELYSSGNLVLTIASNISNDGSFPWAIPTAIMPGSSYRIKVRSLNNSSINDYSDYFSITASDFITVISPNGGENWQAGTSHDITWDDNISGNVKIRLYLYLSNGGYSISTIVSSTPSNGSYLWTIPTYQMLATNYKIEISSTANSSLNDFSDNFFSIMAPSYTITTISNPPEGGSTTGGGTYTEGSEVTITATENQNWLFTNWTEAGNIVSEESSHTFIIEEDRDLVANYIVECQNATANAGNDAFICEGETIQLNGAAENYESILWATNGDGTFDNVNALQTTYHPGIEDNIFGIIELCLTAFAEDPCEDATACITLEIMPLPLVDVGPDLSVCEDQTVTLNQSTVANYSEVSWTSSGDGVFFNPNSPFASYSPGPMDLANGSVELTLTATAVSPCVGSVSDALSVNIQEMPTINIGSDYTICENEPIILTGMIFPGLECDLLINGYPYFENFYIPTPGDIAAGSIEICIECEAPPPCSGSISDCLTVFIQQSPNVDAGEDQTILENENVTLSGSATAYSNILWSSSGDGTFSDPTALVPDYIPGSADISNGNVTLCIEAGAVFPCSVYSSDCMELTIESFNLTTDRQALVALYNATNGPGWTDNTNWLNGSVSNWHGISVEGGRVTEIDLSGPNPFGNYLFGSLPPEIQNLTALERLDLSGNTFLGGGIPDVIGDLISLSYLDLTWCAIGGIIPESIGNLSNLNELYLSRNNLSGDIPTTIGNLSNLQTLELSNNSIIGGIPESLGNLNNLTIFKCYSTTIGGQIPQSIGNLNSLAILSLSYSSLSGAIPESIGNLTNLGGLDLSHNQLTGNIPESMGDLSNLHILYLYSNQLTGIIPESLVNIDNLHELYLNNNFLESPIPMSICTGLSNAEYLTLNNNNFGIEDCPTIQCLIDRGGWNTFNHSPQNDEFDFIEDCIPPCENATANAGNDAFICEGETIQLNGTAEYYESVLWETSGDGTFGDETILQSTYHPGNGDITNGIVELCLTAFAEEGCDDATDCMELSIVPLPTVDVGEDISVCDNVQSVTVEVVAENYSFIEWSSSYGFFNDPSATVTEFFPFGTTEDCEICVTVYPINPPCVTPSEDCLTLYFIPSPMPYAGDDATICEGDIFELAEAYAENYNAIEWTSSGDGTFSDNSSTNPFYTPGSEDMANGWVELNLEALPLPGCNSPANNAMILTIVPPPYIFIEEDIWLDCNYYNFYTNDWDPIFLCPDGYNYTSIQWSTNGDGNFDNANDLCTNYTLGYFEKCGGEVELTIQAFGPGDCGVITQQVTTLHVPGQLITIPPDGEAGISSYIDLQNVPVPDVVFPLVLVPGSQSLITIEDIDGNYYDAENGINTLGNWQPIGYKAEFKSEGCLPMYGNRLIDQTFTVHGHETYLPVLTDVPVNIDDLMADHLDDILLIYCWQTGNIWIPEPVMNSLETLLPGRAYLLQTVEGAVPFEIQFPPYEYPCEGSPPDHYSISGHVTIAGNGTSLPLENVSVQFTDIGEIFTNASGHYSMDVPVGWSGTVTPSKDELTFEPANRNYSNLSWYKSEQDFQVMPNCPTAYAGDDATICENESFQLNGQAENYTSVLWETSGDGTFIDAIALQTHYTPGTNDLINGYTELCLTAFAEEGCVDASDCMELTIVSLPMANAGADISVCDNYTPVPISGIASNFASMEWQTSGDGFFSDETALNTEYSPGFDDLQSGSVILYLIVYPIDPPCSSPIEDSLEVTFIPSPTIAPLSDENICAGESVQFSGVAVDNYSSLAWTTNGDGVFDDPTSSDPLYTPGSQDISTGEVMLCLEAFPLAGCTVSASECMNLSIYPAPEVNAGSDQTIPSIETATLTATANNYSTVLWTTLGDGIFSDPNSLNTEYTPGDQDILSGNVELCISAEAVSPCVLTVTDCLDLNIEPAIETHFTPVWESPYNPMSVIVRLATLDGVDLQAGDEIGIFDIDQVLGDEICVGAGTLNEVLAGSIFLEIITSMDDGSNPEKSNGFTPGNPIIYRLYNTVAGEVLNVVATYPYPGYDEVFASQGTAITELAGFTTVPQTVPLENGWNIMSFFVEPENPDMLNIVQPLIDQDNLIKVLNESGGAINYLPFPPPNGQWTNSIGDHAASEGYYIKVNGNCDLTLEGSQVLLPLQIELSAGWNIISYPCQQPTNAMVVVQPLIDAGVLYKVIDEEGGNIFYLPFPPPNGQWSNSIGNFQGGKGYYVKVSEDYTLTINQPEKGAYLANLPKQAANIHFDPAWQNNPYMPMSLALTGLDELLPGDEIGIFDGEVCVGAGVVAEGEFIVIPVSMDDPGTALQDGFVQGNGISVEIWQQQSNTVFPADLIYLEGVENFQPLETYIGEIKPLLTGVDELSEIGISVNVMPNPFNDHTWIYYNLPENGNVEIALFDLAGKKQFIITQDMFSAGNGKVRLDSQNLNPGCYILKFTFSGNTGQRSINKKLIIR